MANFHMVRMWNGCFYLRVLAWYQTTNAVTCPCLPMYYTFTHHGLSPHHGHHTSLHCDPPQTTILTPCHHHAPAPPPLHRISLGTWTCQTPWMSQTVQRQ